jgi:hypothetical protein
VILVASRIPSHAPCFLNNISTAVTATNVSRRLFRIGAFEECTPCRSLEPDQATIDHSKCPDAIRRSTIHVLTPSLSLSRFSSTPSPSLAHIITSITSCSEIGLVLLTHHRVLSELSGAIYHASQPCTPFFTHPLGLYHVLYLVLHF